MAQMNNVFKLQIRNIGRNLTKKSVIKLLDQIGISQTAYSALKKVPQHDVTILSFQNKDSMTSMQEKLSQLKHPDSGEDLEVEVYVPKIVTKKDLVSTENEANPEKNIIPLKDTEYPGQLKWKQKDIVKALKKIKREAVKFETKLCGRTLDVLPFWMQPDYMKKDVDWQELKRQKLERGEKPILHEYNTGEIQKACCPVDKILPSPLTEGYRNKCEFTFGLNSEQKPALGFRSGSFRDRKLEILKIDDRFIHVEQAMKDLVNFYETEILPKSTYSIYDVFSKEGVWRQITVRTNESEIMIMIQAKKANTEEETLETEIKTIADTLLKKTFNNKTVVSINFIWYDGNSVQDDGVVDRVFGEKEIVIKLCDVDFKVSPTAFFQVNTKGAEVLFGQVASHIKKLVKKGKKCVLLDVCCGTGTIGLSLSKDVHTIIGVDNNQSCIDDARRNAALNNIEATYVRANAEHVLGNLLADEGKRYNSTSTMNEDKERIEKMDPKEKENLDKIRKLIQQAKTDESFEFIAIVDPPRAGLHRSVIRALRSADKLQHVIYVSCNPTGSFVNDAKQFCATTSSKRRPGVPFYPVTATPVDMFPHTKHTELVTMFSRLPQPETSKESK